MKTETREICYDEELKIELYHLKGKIQTFPDHFHDYYVIGCILSGSRGMRYNNQSYHLKLGDIFIFQPKETHACIQVEDIAFEFCALHIPKEIMHNIYTEITGSEGHPRFLANVIYNQEIYANFKLLQQMILEDSKEFAKEEYFLTLLHSLIDFKEETVDKEDRCKDEVIQQACTYMEVNYMNHITLDELCNKCATSKSSLLRIFTKRKGITPYRYLQTIRIDIAKQLLESGEAPSDVAIKTGFSDQSHFTNFFTMFIGISPAAYQMIFRKDQHGKGTLL